MTARKKKKKTSWELTYRHQRCVWRWFSKLLQVGYVSMLVPWRVPKSIHITPNQPNHPNQSRSPQINQITQITQINPHQSNFTYFVFSLGHPNSSILLEVPRKSTCLLTITQAIDHQPGWILTKSKTRSQCRIFLYKTGTGMSHKVGING